MSSLTWHGHSAFQINAPDASIIIDPFFTGNPTAVTTWDKIKQPDAVFVTHMHDDHVGDAVAICKKTGALFGGVVGLAGAMVEKGIPQEQVINGIGFNIGGTVTVGKTRVTMVEAFHTTEAGACTGFILTLEDGYTIYHPGDTGIFANMKIWSKLYPIDLALLPCGGVFTMDARQAAMAARLLGAKQVIPMHWKTFPPLAQSPDEFVAELKKAAPDCVCTVMAPGETIELARV